MSHDVLMVEGGLHLGWRYSRFICLRAAHTTRLLHSASLHQWSKRLFYRGVRGSIPYESCAATIGWGCSRSPCRIGIAVHSRVRVSASVYSYEIVVLKGLDDMLRRWWLHVHLIVHKHIDVVLLSYRLLSLLVVCGADSRQLLSLFLLIHFT